MSKHNHNNHGCCGGHNTSCACSAEAKGLITKDEADILRLVNSIMERGKKTSEKENTLYAEMLADANLTNIK